MTSVFVDTSALLALVNPKDEAHHLARNAFETLTKRESPLLSTSFVVVELYALLGQRIGLDAVRRFRAELAPLIEVVWVDESLHEAGLDLLLERASVH